MKKYVVEWIAPKGIHTMIGQVSEPMDKVDAKLMRSGFKKAKILSRIRPEEKKNG